MKNRFFVLALALLTPSAAAASQEQLASARSLYEAASYEAALTELEAIDGKFDRDVVDTYKALCLLGLGRAREAEQALEQLVTRRPLLTLSESEYSPRVVMLFRDVRRRTLPQAAQQLYAVAKADYDAQRFGPAAAAFKQTLGVIADISPKEQTPALADLKQLAEGFLTLSEAKAAVQAPPPQVQPAPAPSNSMAAPAAPAPARAAAAALPASAVYTLADAGITPPVVINQRMPPWTYQQRALDRKFSGRFEVTIDETGAVESSRIVQSIWGPYDAQLMQAAASWKYQPALKDGKPVKFRRVMDINVDPTGRSQ